MSLKNTHDYFDKHEWVEMEDKHLHLVLPAFGQAFVDELPGMLGLKLHACLCGAVRIVDKDGRELRMDEEI